MLIYPATFEKGKKYIIVKFPDIPEAMTQGKDLEQAYKKAVEVLGFALEDYSSYPKPSDLGSIKAKFPDKEVALIGFDPIEYRKKYHSKTVRKSVTIPEWLNESAKEAGINFSSTLSDALQEKLGL